MAQDAALALCDILLALGDIPPSTHGTSFAPSSTSFIARELVYYSIKLDVANLLSLDYLSVYFRLH